MSDIDEGQGRLAQEQIPSEFMAGSQDDRYRPKEPVPVLRGVLGPDLRVVFVGFQPGPTDIRLKHHHARRNNQFWRLLATSGLTSRVLAPHQDEQLLEWGLGIISPVRRRGAGDARSWPDRISAVAPELKKLAETSPPRVLAYVGKGVYLAAAATTAAPWGRQASSIFQGIPDVVLPSPSGKVRMTFDSKLRYYRELASLVRQLPG